MMNKTDKPSEMAAYGGSGWDPRSDSMRDEIGRLWTACGISSEWAPLQSVLLHPPGPEINAVEDPNAMQMIARIELEKACRQHNALAAEYSKAGIVVHYVEPASQPPPNLMFMADLFFMTPEGAILARPASTVRSGEEIFVARKLAALGIPILRSIRGTGTFEGADAAWLNPQTVLLARGLRTNTEGADQVKHLLEEMGVDVIQTVLPAGAMHLMGMLRCVDDDLALAWPKRFPSKAEKDMHERGFDVVFIPDEVEAREGFALNFVVLGPRRILMPSGNPITKKFYEDLGLTCHTVSVDELIKAAGAIGCLTGILHRAPV